MAKEYKTPSAFRVALETRLKQQAEKEHVPLAPLRLKVAIERFLARLFSIPDPQWLLKGGYAMELRYRPRARTTKDVDLSAKSGAGDLKSRLEALREELQLASEKDLGDHFQFQVQAPDAELQGAPDGGARSPIVALVAGRVFERFHLDVGFGDPLLSAPEVLAGQDFLEFAGIAPATALAIPKTQQFAEKLHAYTFAWNDRVNTRTKDLVDMVMFVTLDPPDEEQLKAAIEETFRRRNTHPLPKELLPPPESWQATFAQMAEEATLTTTDYFEGFQLVNDFLREILASV
jgi:hypothetical protein